MAETKPAAPETTAKPAAKPLPAPVVKHVGTSTEMKTYRVGPRGHYRQGQLYANGDLVSIPSDEKPGKDWAPVDETPARVK